jgi:hypothetical protein
MGKHKVVRDVYPLSLLCVKGSIGSFMNCSGIHHHHHRLQRDWKRIKRCSKACSWYHLAAPDENTHDIVVLFYNIVCIHPADKH